MEKDTCNNICLEERVEDSFGSMQVERVGDSYDNIQERELKTLYLMFGWRN